MYWRQYNKCVYGSITSSSCSTCGSRQMVQEGFKCSLHIDPTVLCYYSLSSVNFNKNPFVSSNSSYSWTEYGIADVLTPIQQMCLWINNTQPLVIWLNIARRCFQWDYNQMLQLQFPLEVFVVKLRSVLLINMPLNLTCHSYIFESIDGKKYKQMCWLNSLIHTQPLVIWLNIARFARYFTSTGNWVGKLMSFSMYQGV
jgi:hypothetical protein